VRRASRCGNLEVVAAGEPGEAAPNGARSGGSGAPRHGRRGTVPARRDVDNALAAGQVKRGGGRRIGARIAGGTTLHTPLLPMFGRCAACVAQETPYGWWILTAVVAVASVALALVFVWLDRRAT